MEVKYDYPNRLESFVKSIDEKNGELVDFLNYKVKESLTEVQLF